MCEESVHHLQVLFKAIRFYKYAKISDWVLLGLSQISGVQNAMYEIINNTNECYLSINLYILVPNLSIKILLKFGICDKH